MSAKSNEKVPFSPQNLSTTITSLRILLVVIIFILTSLILRNAAEHSKPKIHRGVKGNGTQRRGGSNNYGHQIMKSLRHGRSVPDNIPEMNTKSRMEFRSDVDELREDVKAPSVRSSDFNVDTIKAFLKKDVEGWFGFADNKPEDGKPEPKTPRRVEVLAEQRKPPPQVVPVHKKEYEKEQKSSRDNEVAEGRKPPPPPPPAQVVPKKDFEEERKDNQMMKQEENSNKGQPAVLWSNKHSTLDRPIQIVNPKTQITNIIHDDSFSQNNHENSGDDSGVDDGDGDDDNNNDDENDNNNGDDDDDDDDDDAKESSPEEEALTGDDTFVEPDDGINPSQTDFKVTSVGHRTTYIQPQTSGHENDDYHGEVQPYPTMSLPVPQITAKPEININGSVNLGSKKIQVSVNMSGLFKLNPTSNDRGNMRKPAIEPTVLQALTNSIFTTSTSPKPAMLLRSMDGIISPTNDSLGRPDSTTAKNKPPETTTGPTISSPTTTTKIPETTPRTTVILTPSPRQEIKPTGEKNLVLPLLFGKPSPTPPQVVKQQLLVSDKLDQFESNDHSDESLERLIQQAQKPIWLPYNHTPSPLTPKPTVKQQPSPIPVKQQSSTEKPSKLSQLFNNQEEQKANQRKNASSSTEKPMESQIFTKLKQAILNDLKIQSTGRQKQFLNNIEKLQPQSPNKVNQIPLQNQAMLIKQFKEAFDSKTKGGLTLDKIKQTILKDVTQTLNSNGQPSPNPKGPENQTIPANYSNQQPQQMGKSFKPEDQQVTPTPTLPTKVKENPLEQNPSPDLLKKPVPTTTEPKLTTTVLPPPAIPSQLPNTTQSNCNKTQNQTATVSTQTPTSTTNRRPIEPVQPVAQAPHNHSYPTTVKKIHEKDYNTTAPHSHVVLSIKPYHDEEPSIDPGIPKNKKKDDIPDDYFD